jgi:hypothetical protein
MNNKEYSKKKELFNNNMIRNNFEKKPTNGGTPARDNKIKVIIVIK